MRLETYFAEDGRLTTRRDWHITDAVTGAYLGAATSTWVTINAETRKLAKLPEDVRARWLVLAPSPPRAVLPPGDTKRKLEDFPEAPAWRGPVVSARRSDVDPNGHINNVCYLSWALEAVPEELYSGYDLVEVEMDFKAECHAGDTVEVLGHPLTAGAAAIGGGANGAVANGVANGSSGSGTNGSGGGGGGSGGAQRLLHLLRKPGGGGEVWRARTTWLPKRRGGGGGSSGGNGNGNGARKQ